MAFGHVGWLRPIKGINRIKIREHTPLELAETNQRGRFVDKKSSSYQGDNKTTKSRRSTYKNGRQKYLITAYFQTSFQPRPLNQVDNELIFYWLCTVVTVKLNQRT